MAAAKMAADRGVRIHVVGLGTVDGTAATSATVNGLYTINGAHTYGHPGAFHVTITVSATGTPSATTTTTLKWHR